jgi:hypothetical protein
MAAKRKKSSKKVKSLKPKSLSADKAKRVRGGATFGVQSQYKPSKLTERASVKIG